MPCNSGMLKLKGIRPWNQGLTVWRSVETTSTGFVLAVALMSSSATSLHE